jgi:preprotein translocase subunit YajC
MMTFVQLFALGAPQPGAVPFWTQLIPFALVIAIFYFIIIVPARRKQKVSRLGEQSVQLQIADKVKIEVARASIGGYQGQPPVAPASE